MLWALEHISYQQYEEIMEKEENYRKAQEDFEFLFNTYNTKTRKPIDNYRSYSFVPEKWADITIKLYPFLPSDVQITKQKIWNCTTSSPQKLLFPHLILADHVYGYSDISFSLTPNERDSTNIKQKYYSQLYTYIDKESKKKVIIPAIFPYYEYSFTMNTSIPWESHSINIWYKSMPIRTQPTQYKLTHSIKYNPDALKK